jgi:Holliday junction resolvase
MSNYARGRRKEYKMQGFLRKQGYLVVRSAGSKSPFDLIAIPMMKHSEDYAPVRLVQVKVRKMTSAEVEETKKLRKKVPSCCRIEMWVVQDRKEPVLQFSV